MNKIFLFIFIILSFSISSYAGDIYVSNANPVGTKSSGKSTLGDWTTASNCYSTLNGAIAAMSSGDTIWINDGTYSGGGNLINQGSSVKSGSAGAFSVIRARNVPGQDGNPDNTPLKVKFLSGAGVYITNTASISYIKFYGLYFEDTYTYSGIDHLYFKQCAFVGTMDNNNHSVSLGGSNNLIEDSVAYGKGRYKFVFYDATQGSLTGNNLCRRCVARNDYDDNSVTTNPVADFADYYSMRGTFLNCISIDSNYPKYWWPNSNEIDGAFYQPRPSEVDMVVQGSVVINNAGGVGSCGYQNNTFTDIAGINVGGGLWLKYPGVINRFTLVNAATAQFNASPFGPYNPGTVLSANNGVVNGGQGASTVSNSIFRGIFGTVLGATGSYINYFSYGSLGTSPTHPITTDPFLTGLLYPIRIETGGSLLTAGSSGGQVGARIVNKLGIDGTFYGDTNYNTEQGSLWPFPLENWIQAQMASMPGTISGSTMPSATRGFASSSAKQLDGTSSVTLTSYIWESLGNQIPSSIYGGSGVSSTTKSINGNGSNTGGNGFSLLGTHKEYPLGIGGAGSFYLLPPFGAIIQHNNKQSEIKF